MKKRRITLVLSALCVLSVLVGTLALFTDRVQAQAKATAGTLDLTLSNFVASQTTDFKPGESINITYNLANAGNKSADVRETIVLTVNRALEQETVADLELYNANGSAVLATGSNRQMTVNGNKTTITYTLTPEFILSGTGTAAEIEYNGNTPYASSKSGAFKLVFSKDAGNDLQDASINIEYLAQAKQHRNTGDDTWANMLKETVTFSRSGLSFAAVPAKSGS